jgi:DNA-binding FadR family transcriptional regulator
VSKRGALVNQILEGIKNGSLVENGQLPSERALANQLGISRILLRETIVVLETLGVVESKERLGIFVKKPDISGLAESLRIMPYWSESFVPQLIEIRLMTDVQAAELAALRRTE